MKHKSGRTTLKKKNMQNRSQFKQSGSLSKKKKKYRYIHKKNTIVSRTLSRFSYESDLINLTTKKFLTYQSGQVIVQKYIFSRTSKSDYAVILKHLGLTN